MRAWPGFAMRCVVAGFRSTRYGEAMARRLRLVVLPVVLLVAGGALAACSPTTVDGTLKGVAADCSGVVPPFHADSLRVSLSVDSTPFATTVIRSGSTFTFVIPPGHYVVSTRYRGVRVRVDAGKTVSVSLVPICSSAGNPSGG